MADSVFDRLCDQLVVDRGYEGPVALAYDTWISVDTVFGDDPVYEAVLADIEGTVLELGCGTGRPLLRWLAAGHDVEGIDSSGDMLAILHQHAAERGLDPVVHHGDFAPLRLGGTYAAIVCPAGTFTLVADAEQAVEALASYFTHLRPGGLLGLTLFVPDDPGANALQWRVRRTGTASDGTTFVVHEAICHDRADRLEVKYNRVEAYDIDGRLIDTWLRRYHGRWWPRPEFEAMLEHAGFVDVRSVGDDAAWVTLATKP